MFFSMHCVLCHKTKGLEMKKLHMRSANIPQPCVTIGLPVLPCKIPQIRPWKRSPPTVCCTDASAQLRITTVSSDLVHPQIGFIGMEEEDLTLTHRITKKDEVILRLDTELHGTALWIEP